MEKIRVSKKQGGIVEALKGAILSGDIPSGTEMTQNELAESLGVSRMPVREALILLEYQGLVERLPNNHIKAAEFSAEYFEEIFKLCGNLECRALKHCYSQKEENTEYMQMFTDELEFHRKIYEICPFGLQKKLLETMTEIYVSFVIDSMFYHKSDRKKLLDQIYKVAFESAESAKKKDAEIQKLFEQYYSVFPEIMMKVRNK